MQLHSGTLGRIYIWVGKGTPASQVQIAHQVASELLNKNDFPVVVRIGGEIRIKECLALGSR